MTALLQEQLYSHFEADIEAHAAWLGFVRGLDAEKMLRGQAPFTYVLRAGEELLSYYVTFVDAQGVVRHQPFVVTLTEAGWYCENGIGVGPYGYEDVVIGDILHNIMHSTSKEACVPLVRN
jgi:hypothetical protein